MTGPFDFKLHAYDDDYYRIYDKLADVDFGKIPSFRLLRHFLDVQTGERVLDAGCGDGHLLAYVTAAKNAFATGVDGSRAALERGRQMFPQTAFARQDLRALAFKDESFDKILCFNVIEHIAAQERVMAEFQRVLKPGGLLVAGTNIKDSIQWWLYQKFIGEHTHVHEFSVPEFLTFVSRFFCVRAYRKSSGVFRFKPPLSWVSHHLFKGDIIVCCRKEI